MVITAAFGCEGAAEPEEKREQRKNLEQNGLGQHSSSLNTELTSPRITKW